MTAKKKSTTAKVSKVKEIPEMVESDIVTLYMEYVLEHERFPKSVYKFCKDIGIEETLFYQFFGSFESLQKSIWNQFFDLTINLSNKNENYAGFSNREKLLTFFYTMFELLTANRSYVLFVLKEQSNQDFMKRMNQFKGLKKRVKGFAATLIQHENMNKHSMIGRNPVTVFFRRRLGYNLYSYYDFGSKMTPLVLKKT